MSRKLGMTPEKIARWIKEGRGKGELKNYKPWLTHRDVPSNGWRIRIRGFVTDRTHHTFSKGEANILRPLDLSPATRDIREQFPLLPLDETVAIAKQLGVKHPTDPITKHFIVMTTDFLWCTDGQQIPIDSKPSSELVKPRVIEKLEIARSYWTIHNCQWRLSIDSDIPKTLTENCENFHGVLYLDGLNINIRDVEDVARIMTKYVLQQEMALRKIARAVDDQLGLKTGTSLRIAFHFMARRFWQVDWYKPQQGETTVKLLGYDRNFDFSKSFRIPATKD
jgi:hypothetical protein